MCVGGGVCDPVSGGGGGGMVWGWHCWWWGGRVWVLCWLGVWASDWVVWVLRVRAVRSLSSLAGCGAEVRVGGGRLGTRAVLWSVGSGRLPVDGACWVVGQGAAGGGGVLLLGPGAAGARARPPVSSWGCTMVGIS